MPRIAPTSISYVCRVGKTPVKYNPHNVANGILNCDLYRKNIYTHLIVHVENKRVFTTFSLFEKKNQMQISWLVSCLLQSVKHLRFGQSNNYVRIFLRFSKLYMYIYIYVTQIYLSYQPYNLALILSQIHYISAL